jgi:signal transduction histidine kinase
MQKRPSRDIHSPRRAGGLVARLCSLLGIAARFGVLREPKRLVDRVLEEQKTQNLRFDTAINNMSQGLCLFDGKQRLIVCNDLYAGMYKLTRDLVRPGTTLAEIVDHRFAAGCFPDMTRAEYMLWRDSIAISPVPSDTVLELKDGRTIAVHHQPMPDGGWVATHDDITERKRAEEALRRANEQLRETQGELVTTARQAGMAEIANNVLHNVGNVLNSVNVSAGLVSSKMRDSKARGLAKAVQLMNEHAADLGDFLTRDEKGKMLPAYLNKLVAALATEQQSVVEELGSLTKSIDHIKDIVATQQSYAGASSVVEAVQVRDLLEDALRMNAGAMARHQVTVIKEFADVPLLLLDKPRLLQILVNLIGNAKQAMDSVIDRPHQMTLRMDVANLVDRGNLRVRVEDNGEGIAPENMARLFVHGFTTRKNGHGFGLHSCALAAKEMGGRLLAHSDGAGKGAAFTLELPINPVADPQ